MLAASPGSETRILTAPSAMGVTAMVAVLHLAVLAGRVSPRHGCRQGMLVVWQAPLANPDRAGAAEDDRPSNPVQTYSAGRLALTFGMAVVTLARWLHIMRISGARTY